MCVFNIEKPEEPGEYCYIQTHSPFEDPTEVEVTGTYGNYVETKTGAIDNQQKLWARCDNVCRCHKR